MPLDLRYSSRSVPSKLRYKGKSSVHVLVLQRTYLDPCALTMNFSSPLGSIPGIQSNGVLAMLSLVEVGSPVWTTQITSPPVYAQASAPSQQTKGGGTYLAVPLDECIDGLVRLQNVVYGPVAVGEVEVLDIDHDQCRVLGRDGGCASESLRDFTESKGRCRCAGHI